MTRYVPIGLLCFVLACISIACAPKRVGPTPTAGYFFSVLVTDPSIYVVVNRREGYPGYTVLIVRVQNAQGQAVNGVPVIFELEPSWVPVATITPQVATTSDGTARAVFQADTTGIARIFVRVDGLTREVTVAVMSLPLERDRMDATQLLRGYRWR